MNADKQVYNILKTAGVIIPDILLPDPSRCDNEKWSVVACDQFTSNQKYWESVDHCVGSAPSSLRLILPEIYLADNFSDRVEAIYKKMGEYLDGNIFLPPYCGFILTHRTLRDKAEGNRHRWGLILAIDLEAYSFAPDSKSLIRSSEKTVRDRLPPRSAIRRGAALELPHVLLLADDERHTLIEPLAEDANAGLLEKVYDFELMADGGHICGYRIEGDAMRRAANAIAGLLNESYKTSAEPILFAVGDGNHSLAAAKANWDEIKGALPHDKHEGFPARYALVELINLHSGAIQFEPIHRALYNTKPQDVIDELGTYFLHNGMSINTANAADTADTANAADTANTADTANAANATDTDVVRDVHISERYYCYQLIYERHKTASLHIANPKNELAVAEIQGFIDYFCLKYPDTKIDYIHGTDELSRLAAEEGCFCFLLPDIDKHGFFAAISANGAMPGKSFSMGEAWDKRYYLEARKI